MELKNGKYYLPDIETGHKIEVTREQYEAYLKLYNSFRDIATPKVGRPLIIGTGGDLDDNKSDLKELFYKTGSFSI